MRSRRCSCATPGKARGRPYDLGPIQRHPPYRAEVLRKLFSKPVRVRLDPANTSPVTLSLTEKIPPAAPPADTPWIKQVRIKSQILSDFWGLPITIGAEVLLPKNFAENPNSRYPAIYTLGHNLGVYKFQEMVTELAGRDYPLRFEYGRPKKGHSWHHTDWAGVVREVADYVRRIAPPGAPIADWND